VSERTIDTIRIIAYVFFLFFVLPVLIFALVVVLAPLVVLLVLMVAFVVIFTQIPWTPPEFSLAAEVILIALYQITREKLLLEVAENLATHRKKSLELDREEDIERALEEGDTKRALRLYLREIMERVVGSPPHAKPEDRGDD